MAPLLATAIPTLINLLPDFAKWFGGDKAEKMTTEVLNIATNITGISDKNKALEAIMADPQTALEFQKAVMNDKYRLDEIYLQDVRDAREMQEKALEQEDLFSKRFLYYFATGWSAFAAIYLLCITFVTIPADNISTVQTVTGFIMGTLISSIIQFFFGSTKGSKDKDTIAQELIKKINIKEE